MARDSDPKGDGEATTMAAGGATLQERSSRTELELLGAGSMIGRYRLKKRLGAGAMGVVWSALDPRLDREVAIKLVHPELARSEQARQRLLREARAMAKLSHRSVITIHDGGDVDGQLFIAMELVRGTTLGNLLRTRDAASLAAWPRWLAMMIDAGRGLAEAHRNGVLHRDFKPDNVLVDESGRVCVGDFGLATLGDRSNKRTDTGPVDVSAFQTASMPVARGPMELATHGPAFDLTTTGAVLGTPMYMSPQQLNGEAVDARADQFAFCIALYEAMYGARPFSTTAEGLAAIPGLAEEIERGVPEPPPHSTVPRAIHDCIRRGLSPDPALRWPDMDALIAALERAGRRTSTVLTPAPSRRWLVLAALATVGLGAVAVAFALTRSPRRPEPAPSGEPPSLPVARQPTFTKLFGSPLNTKTAISPSGRRIALGGDTVEVRSVDGAETKQISSIPLPRGYYGVLYLELDDHEVRFSLDDGNARWRWRYEESTVAVVDVEDLGGRWRGSTVAGELISIDRKLSHVDRDRKLEPWTTRPVDVLSISPDRRRVAFLEGGRFTGQIVVRDVTSGHITRSEVLEEPTALAWLDKDTIVYATSTLVKPRISRATVTTSFGKPEILVEAETGWYSDLAVGGGQLFVVSMPPKPRGRIIERGGVDRELDSVSLAVAWDAGGRYVTWNASSKLVKPSGTPSPVLASEPVNATMHGEVLIATLRDLGGRVVVAVSLTDGKPVWRGADKRTHAVRCAGDRAAPCFAIRSIRDDLDHIVGIDPQTGTLSTKPIYEAIRIEDIAVSPDGTRVVVTGAGTVLELDHRGAVIQKHEVRNASGGVGMNLIRSIAYDPNGGFLLAGTIGRNNYQVGKLVDGRYQELDDARDKILSLVRPSADGSKITFIARGYEPELFWVRFP